MAHTAGTKKLGSWFPTASVAKAAPVEGKCTILLFYHYCRPELEKDAKQRLIAFLQDTTGRLQLGGRLRVANEGINSTMSGTADAVREFADALTNWAAKAGKGPFLNPTPDYKYIDDLPPDRAFKDLKILPVNELVFYGVDEKHAPLVNGGTHLDPKDYHQKMKENDTVIIDVRNHYEAEIGRFDGQEKEGGAKYIDPKMRKSTDFKQWLAKDETKAELKGKQVLMYCTGGVRCERASALLNTEMGKDLGGIFQLQGGIEKYLQEFPEGGHWQGKNYVFDKREAFGVGNLAGVGGVVEGGKKKKEKAGKGLSEGVLGKCCVCACEWDRYIGKKKCYTCGVPVLMCSACCTLKPDKTPGKELTVRCPLCVQQNITVPAADVQLTDNGVGVSISKKTKSDGGRNRTNGKEGEGKSAPSVCKWGGGHAVDKKKTRAVKTFGKKCKLGDECTRSACYFTHPKDAKAKANEHSKRPHDSGSAAEVTKKRNVDTTVEKGSNIDILSKVMLSAKERKSVSQPHGDKEQKISKKTKISKKL
ncbi:hypothetical protein SARC_00946 [Sphaeroforma arctica JP610]|uniref:Rhodanese domain-containing protein n=1 Tax=Sphaeroforma arctica JP610 TaxID=667725 RepID=A0A0L0GDD9_9EUKA|nr:hypothetical protein SARC_00946 [Sphaeroforma arctica JP610]KNC86901.1 hypothetical protein SARC_00946 [Sphaeroforma arctica JP610]|eukprot:XP_014160803.1 hypothetical protein SARC_00946 [Sphaeroforma arctica JP610]